MKKWAILAIILLSSWTFWSTTNGPSSPWGTTKRFLMAVGSMHKQEALDLAEDAARDAIEKTESTAGWVPMDAYRGQTFAKMSSEKLPSGDLRMNVSEVLFFDPPGATTALGGAMAASFNDTVVLSKKSGKWKIASFERIFIRADSARH